MRQIFRFIVVALALQPCLLAEIPDEVFNEDGPLRPDTHLPHVERRNAVPDAAAQASALKTVRSDLYKSDFDAAKSPSQKIELARKLISVANDTADVAAKYVLLESAKSLAIEAGNPAVAINAFDELSKAYAISDSQAKLDLFSLLANKLSKPDDIGQMINGINRWADAQVKFDHYDEAKKACAIAIRTARTAHDNGAANKSSSHLKQIEAIDAIYASVKPLLAASTTQPANPANANAIGRFYCLAKGDWERGLPMLAASNDPTLKTVGRERANGERSLRCEASRCGPLVEFVRTGQRDGKTSHAGAFGGAVPSAPAHASRLGKSKS